MTVVDHASGRHSDLEIAAPAALPVGAVIDAVVEAVRAVPSAAGDAGSPPYDENSATVLDPSTPFGRSGLRDGAVLVLPSAGPASVIAGAATGVASPTGPGASAHLRVVGGPASGEIGRLPAGRHVVGRGAEAALRLDDLRVSRCHAELTMEPGGSVLVRDLSSANGTCVDGVSVAVAASLRPGALLRVGDSLLTIATPGARDDPAGRPAVVTAGPRGLVVNPPPRLAEADVTPVITLPVEAQPAPASSVPVASLVAPAVLGLVAAAVLRNWQYLLFALLSPVAAGASFLTERRAGRSRRRRAAAAYQAESVAARAALTAAVHSDEQRRRSAFPDPATLLLAATTPTDRLWQRRSADPDALVLRVGLGDRRARVELTGGGSPGPPIEPPVARLVPVTVSLPDARVIGVAGPPAAARALARWLVLQAAVLHPPHELGIVLLTDGQEGAAQWGSLRWLPHAQPVGAEAGCRVLLGTDAVTRQRRVGELLSAVEAGRRDGRRFLVVADGAHRLRDVPGLPRLLATGPAAGVFALCVDDEARLLPRECAALLDIDAADPSPTRLTAYLPGGERVPDVLVDQVSAAWAERVARAMAPLRTVDSASGGDRSGAGDANGELRLLDLLRLPRDDGGGPAVAAVIERWVKGSRAPVATLGTGTGGPVAVDLRRDGPHALVAGTTGSGKSELLTTLIASLALAAPPDALTFLLVDYKGGTSFAECAELPHVAGLLTDLDNRSTERALASLTAELRRREAALRAAGVQRLDDLTGAEARALPRLVIVVDEFATLVEELPEFVRGLVGVAQRGRSLGVHLVLATQRPGGAVSADIRANTNLRLCLRVTDPAESLDVIDSPDAADLPDTAPGLGYLRTGPTAPLRLRVARVGAPIRGAGQAADAVRCVPLGWHELGHPRVVAATDEATTPNRTDLAAIVAAARAAAHRLDLPQAAAPWLPPLPTQVLMADLPPVTRPGALRLGLLDLPERQARGTYGVDLEAGGHLLVVGAPRSGRSTALLALTGAAVRRYPPDDLHLHVVDCGSAAALRPIAALPHCGSYVGRGEADRLDRLLARLLDEVADRQRRLTAGGFGDVREQRAAASPAERLPWVMVLLDGWDSFAQTYGEVDLGRPVESVTRLLREGPAAGVRVVVTADRSGLSGRLASLIDERLVLRLADRSDYALAGIPTRLLPRDLPPGRAVASGPDGPREVQVALLDRDPTLASQAAALARSAAAAGAAGAASAARRPFRIDPLPARIDVEAALRLAEKPLPDSPLWALVGVGGDELEPVGVDLAVDGPGLLVAGPPGAGRSTALLTMASSALARGTPVAVVAPRRSPLLELRGAAGVPVVVTDPLSPSDELAEVLTGRLGPLLLVVDDAELVADSPLAASLSAFTTSARDCGRAVIAAGTTDDLLATFRGFLLDLRRSRCGLLLSPRSVTEGELVGARLPRSACRESPPGRGVLARRGELMPVHVAVPS